jgi:hypothetical protein
MARWQAPREDGDLLDDALHDNLADVLLLHDAVDGHLRGRGGCGLAGDAMLAMMAGAHGGGSRINGRGE